MEKYEKVKKIGEGSFGKAILVKSKEDGHQYVIKEIGISAMSSKETQESRKEVAVLANMSHPNIVQYKESFEEGGCLYIVMDYCEGGDLFKKINSQKGVLFSEEQIMDWFVQICLALKHVHDQKILHRDIKSQNIFLTKDGTVQLGDFGIARVLNSTVELARTCIGTPYYLSPEICENKPYNNKSDIWALGCVLYEMCTLKHAFEAGNMKNLVLKIIRGSYPPVSVHYSQELRSLLGLLFKRSPRERPSVSSILDKPFLTCRIERFLTPQIIAQEFRHNFLHKQPKVCMAQGPAAKRPTPGSIPLAPAHRITKPASKYGVPLTARRPPDAVRKPAERRPAVKPRAAPPPAAPHRRVSQVEEERRKHEDGMRKKRMELIEKERKQREQVFLFKAEQMKRYEKEKINRINQAREQGWKHVLSSSGGSSPERKCFVGGGNRAVPCSAQGPTAAQLYSKTPYEHYHAALDLMSKPQARGSSREGFPAAPGSPARVPVAAGPVMPNVSARLLNPDAIQRELLRLQYVSKPAHVSRPRGHMAAGRAYQVEEFLQRKREAMLNKVRAEGQLGTRQSLAATYGSRAGSIRCWRPRANREEEEYLLRLRQIRLQNFNERQQIKARLRGEKCDSDGSDSQESSEEAELRRRKIEALKAQAHARAAVLREQLEKKRVDALEREKRSWEEHLAARGVKVGVTAAGDTAVEEVPSDAPQLSPSQPDAAAQLISMTAALQNVGAITPLKEKLSQPETAAVVQSEKKQILRRLNQNLKAQSPEEEVEGSPPAPQQNQPDTEERPAADGDRKKWEAAELPVLPAQQTLEETCITAMSPEERPSSGADRKKWEAGVPFVLSVAQHTLEETGIRTIEQTVGEVIQICGLHEEGPRKVWRASPDSQVLRVLQEAELQPLTQQLENSVCEDPSPDEPHRAAVEMKTPEEEVLSSKTPAELQSAAGAERADLTETQDPADMEFLVLEETSNPTSRPRVAALQAWQQEAQQPMPAEDAVRPADAEEAEQRAEKHVGASGSAGSAQSEEPLFVKLCSPAHRRTAALALLSAQSSMDESSSSLASRSRSVSPLRSKHHDALLISLSTGMFDANNPKMLRTCSLPDLSRLFSPQQDSAGTSDANAAADNNLEIEDLEEEEAAAAKGDDQSETEDAYEDEDLRDIRASMERLLQEEVGAGDFNGNPPEEVLFDRIDHDNNQMAVDDDEEDEEEEDEEDEGDEEEDEECSNGSPEEAGELLTNGGGDGNLSNTSELNEEWHSDGSGEEPGGEAAHHDSIFSRLEELRFNLEQQMGFEKFIEAYNKIKVHICTTGLIVTPPPSSPVTTATVFTFPSETSYTSVSVDALPPPPPPPPQSSVDGAAYSLAAGQRPSPSISDQSGRQRPTVYVAMFPYSPRKEDELELRKGEMFLVLERCQDGWFKGTSMHTGKIGVFPGNYMSPVNRTASGSTQPKVPMSLCPPAGRGVTIVSPSSVPGPDFKALALCSGALPVNGPPAAVTAAQTATGQQPKVALHVSSQMTVNQARNAVRTAACHGQDRPTAAVTPIQSAGTYLPHLTVCPQPSSSPAQCCTRAGVAMGCAAASLTPPNVSAASLEGDGLRPLVLTMPGSGSQQPNSSALACRLDKDVKREKKSLLKLLSSNKKKSRPSPPSSPTLEAEQAAGDVTHGAAGPDTSPPSGSVGSLESDPAAAVPEPSHRKSGPLDGCAPIAPPPRQPCSSLVSQHDARPIICERYRVVVSYPPQSEAELELKEGDIVFVHRKREDGWFKGTLQRNGRTGLFPGSFVDLI
ncbi:LOW QUALITY PROTEIN: serine/threonine-protein kinase Nek1 [Cottoperca gobio]|uniref:LOW QUALITY PROTEIN: serine/threonine-protein kinase Nek1 n=1 Tax=Cottoperca gobio TaxID=56716 RepID=A0A6J2P9Z0_COTGO|nr:LOW QUALITY PROTEIN: serine/threonine-protein kinase Nek1-like [Cottoperca gobio]